MTVIERLISLARKLIPPRYLDILSLRRSASSEGLQVKFTKSRICIRSKNRMLFLSNTHFHYCLDILRDFNYYFESVEGVSTEDGLVVDFSRPGYHSVRAFDLMPVHFPSLAEPLSTTNQYLAFAGLAPGDTVIDLGAYSGLTSILFSQQVGDKGRVIAVEPDLTCLESLRRNVGLYKSITGQTIEIEEKAIWKNSEGVSFNAHGNMGSHVRVDLTQGLGDKFFVPSISLSDLVNTYQIEKVHFIKCDVEGAERYIFEDLVFFQQQRPGIILEVHEQYPGDLFEKIKSDLSPFGYSCNLVSQPGVGYPLMECVPSS